MGERLRCGWKPRQRSPLRTPSAHFLDPQFKLLPWVKLLDNLPDSAFDGGEFLFRSHSVQLLEQGLGRAVRAPPEGVSRSVFQAVQPKQQHKEIEDMSPIIKWTTSLLPPPPPGGTSPVKRTINDWENHPSLITGVEALEAYQTWVSGVVLPI